MWSRREFFAKQTEKMIAGQAGFPGNLFQIDRFVIALVDEGARATEPLVNLTPNFGFVCHFCERILLLVSPMSNVQGPKPAIEGWTLDNGLGTLDWRAVLSSHRAIRKLQAFIDNREGLAQLGFTDTERRIRKESIPAHECVET